MQWLENINRFILNPLIILLFAIALLVFVIGVIQYISKPEDEDGRRHMIYGVVGMVVMVAARGIVIFIQNTINQL